MRAVHGAATNARASAARAVARVLFQRRFLDSALSELRHELSGAETDWPLIQELSYGTLRWYHQLAGIAALFLKRPLKPKDSDVYALLLIGLYQLRYMRVADHAAVDATVAAAEILRKPWAKGLVNACLRASLRDPGRVQLALAASEEMHYSHPAWLIDAVRQSCPDNWARVLEANNQRPPMTLRVNAARISRADYNSLLRDHGLRADALSQVDSALMLHEAAPVEQLPGFAEGLVSVQDAAAQLAAIWLDTQPNERVLDACAAPGGKTAHILERTPALAELVALDVDAERLSRTCANLARLGLAARLVVGDAAEPKQWWDGRPYDRILVDAPCSGTGVIRRHPDIKIRRGAAELPKLLEAQARILDGVWPCLAPGGKLLYATCSILTEENQLQVRSFVSRHANAVVPPRWGGGPDAIGRRILPGEEGMDGFYYACVHKI